MSDWIPAALKTGTVAVACHDAGAANLILGWLSHAPGLDIRVHAAGPAATIWQRLSPGRPLYTMQDAMAGANVLLSGTGWQGMVEFDARQAASDMGIRTIAAVDHWVNYDSRFVRGGKRLLPDEIWVGDAYAFDIARAEFPSVQVELMPNFYLMDQVEEVHKLQSRMPAAEVQRVLYALEPIRLPWGGDDTRPGEFQALDFFLASLEKIGLDREAEIRLRPHPSDADGKYVEWANARGSEYKITFSHNSPLAEDISWSSLVAGCESYVLVIAEAAGKRVISTLPPWGNICRLPHDSIEHLRDLTYAT